MIAFAISWDTNDVTFPFLGDKVNGEGYSLSRVYLRLDATVRWDWQSGSNSVAENGSGWKTRGQLAQRHPCGASSRILRLRSKDARRQRFSTSISPELKKLYRTLKNCISKIRPFRKNFSFHFVRWVLKIFFNFGIWIDPNCYFNFSFLFIYLDIKKVIFLSQSSTISAPFKIFPEQRHCENDYHLAVENYNVEVS